MYTENSVFVYRKQISILLNWMHLHLFSQVTATWENYCLLNERHIEANAPRLATSFFLSRIFLIEMCVCR